MLFLRPLAKGPGLFSFSTEVTSELLDLRVQLTHRGLRPPSQANFRLTLGTVEEMKTSLEELKTALKQWEDLDFQIRRANPILNLFTHSNIQEFTRADLGRNNLLALLGQRALQENEIQQIKETLKPSESVWNSTFHALRRCFSLPMGLPALVREEAIALQQVARALGSMRQRTAPVTTVASYLKQGSPNLFLLPEAKIVPSVLSMFHDVQGSMPDASQLVICLGMDEMRAPEHLRLFLLRSMLSQSLHVLLLPESLSYKAQEYFLACWRWLVKELQASAGQKKYLLAIVGSQKSCLLFDALRAYQQEPPQMRIGALRRQLEEHCTIVYSRTACAGGREIFCANMCGLWTCMNFT